MSFTATEEASVLTPRPESTRCNTSIVGSISSNSPLLPKFAFQHLEALDHLAHRLLQLPQLVISCLSTRRGSVLRRPHCKHILSSSLQVIKIQHVYSTSFATSSAFSKLLGLPFSKIWWLISGRKPVKNLCKRTLDDLASSRYANLNSFFKSVVKSLTHSCGSWLCIENFRAVASGSTRHQSRSLLE